MAGKGYSDWKRAGIRAGMFVGRAKKSGRDQGGFPRFLLKWTSSRNRILLWPIAIGSCKVRIKVANKKITKALFQTLLFISRNVA